MRTFVIIVCYSHYSMLICLFKLFCLWSSLSNMFHLMYWLSLNFYIILFLYCAYICIFCSAVTAGFDLCRWLLVIFVLFLFFVFSVQLKQIFAVSTDYPLESDVWGIFSEWVYWSIFLCIFFYFFVIRRFQPYAVSFPAAFFVLCVAENTQCYRDVSSVWWTLI